MFNNEPWIEGDLDSIPFHSDKNPYEGALERACTQARINTQERLNEDEARGQALFVKWMAIVCGVGISFGYAAQVFHAFF